MRLQVCCVMSSLHAYLWGLSVHKQTPPYVLPTYYAVGIVFIFIMLHAVSPWGCCLFPQHNFIATESCSFQALLAQTMSANAHIVCASFKVTSTDVSPLLPAGEAGDEAPPPARRSARARPGRPPRPAPPSLPTVAEDEEEQGEEGDNAAEPGKKTVLAKLCTKKACLPG